MQRESESEENVSWNEIGEVLDTEMSTVEDIRADLARNDKGNTCQTINNCMLVFQRDPLLKGAIRKNELSGKIDIVGNLGWQRTSSSLTDTDVYQIHWYLEKNYGLKNDRNINKAMNIVASENKYHPIRDCLEKLKWDGLPRIDNLLPRYLGADHDDYTKEIMRLLMLAAIRRVYEPGCKFEIMVCLVGGQGAGKSTFFRFLAINDEWFSDDLKWMDDDNVYRKMQGHWIIEMSEMMATVNAKSIEDIKSFISRQKETYKIPYETHPEDRPRQCVFVGTSNNMDFLPLDRTGNRRFAPVLVHPERVEKHILEDEKESREYIRQAWAEATKLYRNGYHELKLSRETEEYLKEMQKGNDRGMKWDVLVIDEAHEGVDTYKTDVAFEHVRRKFTLHLSGTPFKALANNKFEDEAIFNWTYADEQKKKRNWDFSSEEENPYADLPKLNLYTYQMSEIIKDTIGLINKDTANLIESIEKSVWKEQKESVEKQYSEVCSSLQEQGFNFDKLDDLLERKKNKLLELDKIKLDKEKLIVADEERKKLYCQYESITQEISSLRSKFINGVIGMDANVKFDIKRGRNRNSFIQMMKSVLHKDNATVEDEINKLADLFFGKNGIEKFRKLMWDIREGVDKKSCQGRMRTAIIETPPESFARMITFIPEDDLQVSYKPENAKSYIPLKWRRNVIIR